MRLNKKELKSLASTYVYYDENMLGDEMHTFTQTLIMLGVLKEVKKAAYTLYKNDLIKEYVDEVASLIQKAYDDKNIFDIDLCIDSTYDDDIAYMDRLTDSEKHRLKTCLNFIV